ncbi:MAG: acyl--CoA ligase [Kiritimatiellales bacterium]|nr:acyl--CoA ligase [Kiritimatiellales bacterium]
MFEAGGVVSLTIKDILNRAAVESADRTVLRFKKNAVWCTYTYKELRERAWHVSEICATLGVEPGDRVALYRENSPEWLEIYFGIVALGAIAVPVDVKLREQEVGHIFHDCGVSVVFTSARNAEVLEELKTMLPDLRAAVLLDALPQTLPESGKIQYAA